MPRRPAHTRPGLASAVAVVVFIAIFPSFASARGTHAPTGGFAPGSAASLAFASGALPEDARHAAYPAGPGSFGVASAGPRGSSSSSSAPGPAAGASKYALLFDGVDDYAVVRDAKHLPTRQITIAGWIRVAKHKSFNRVASHEWVHWGWNLYTDAGGVARFGIGQDNKDFAAGRMIFRNRWHFVCGTYDGEHIRVYVDGQPGAATRLSGATLDNDGYISIGGAEWDPFLGHIDDLRLYNVSLDAAAVRATMLGEVGPAPPGLIGHWRFDEPRMRGVFRVALLKRFRPVGRVARGRYERGGGTTAYDASPVGNHAILGGARRAPTWVPSNATTRVHCVEWGGAVTVELAGGGGSAPVNGGGGEHVLAFVVGLPALGRVLRPTTATEAAAGTFVEITAVPETVSGSRRRVVYEAPIAPSPPTGPAVEAREGEGKDVGRTGPQCAAIPYRVRGHDVADGASEPHVAYVDIMPPGGCERVDGGGVSASRLALGSCTESRSRLEYAAAKASVPAVSIIIPMYNGANLTLEATIDSVLAQTFENWEIIVVDDGSTDGSGAFAARLAERLVSTRGVRVRVVKKANGGLADARNFGFVAARADFVLPLDADDLIEPRFLESAHDLLVKNPDAHLAIADLKGFGDWDYEWILPTYDAVDLRYTNMFHCSALMRRELWEAVPGGYPTTTLFGYEDWAFWLAVQERLSASLSRRGGGDLVPLYVREKMFLYRLRSNSMLQSLLGLQEYSLASLRILYPTSYPIELIVAAHDRFLLAPPEKVRLAVEEKLRKFPHRSAAHLMQGLVMEGAGVEVENARGGNSGTGGDAHRNSGDTGGVEVATSASVLPSHPPQWEDALRSYATAADLASHHDWQPRLRLGLLLQRMGRYDASNATLAALFDDFDGLKGAYRQMHLISATYTGRRSLGPLVH